MSRRRAVAFALACVLAPVLVASSCSGSDEGAQTATGPTSTTSSTTTTATPVDGCDEVRPAEPTGDDAAATAEAEGTYAVGRESRTFVDTTRGTDADVDRGLPASDTRTLPVSVLYPSSGAPAGAGEFVQDAPPAEGTFPLVVYSHGVWSNGTERNDTLARWASAGYVVIAPTFPLSSGLGATTSDLVNQPGDVVLVTTSFTDAVATPSDTLYGVVATDCLALAGHSLGGATTLATAFDPCCGQLDVRAVVDIAGVLIPVTPDARLSDSAPIPTMIVHGDQDPLVAYTQGRRAFDELTGERWLLTLLGGDHNSMFVPPESAALDASVLALLDAELKHDDRGLTALPQTIAGLGGATLESSTP